MNGIASKLPRKGGALDPQLAETIAGMPVEDQLRLAARLQGWANQIYRKHGRSAPTAPRKAPRGFFMVNIAQWRERDMRSVARAFGVDLRKLIGWGVTARYDSLKDDLALAQRFGLEPRFMRFRLCQDNPRN